MLDNAIKGASEIGAEVELFNLYKMQISDCISCFSCKGLDKERHIHGESKKAYRDAYFSNDCQNARQLGEQSASGKLFNS